MKFSDLSEDKWNQYKEYLDTCILPISGLTGVEEPPIVIQKLSELRDVLEWIEVPFVGRVVTYPAVQYHFETDTYRYINQLILNIKKSGFRFVVIVSCDPTIRSSHLQADLIIDPKTHDKFSAKNAIISFWGANVSNL